MSYGHFEARMRRKDVEASPSVALLTRDFLTATGAAPSLILLCSLYEVFLWSSEMMNPERDDDVGTVMGQLQNATKLTRDQVHAYVVDGEAPEKKA
jgi:hypothetical protein